MIKKYLSVLTAVSLSLVAVTGTYSNAAEKEVTEVTTKRSEYRKVFNNGDGTYTAYTNTAPIHFLDNGEWTEIDNTLVDNGDGFYKNKNNSFSVSLPSELNIADAESSAVNLSYEKLNISCALTNIEIPSGFESQPAYIDVNNAVYDSAYDMNIPEGLAAAFSNASAEANYKAISDGLDLNMSVHNSTFTESLVINDVDKIPESVTYSISSEGVQLERAEDNSLLFVRDGEIVLEIPMFVMYDSSEELNEFIINYDIFETETGYDVVLYPLSSIGDVSPVVMPMSLSSNFYVERTVSTLYNSESTPGTISRDSFIKISSKTNDKHQTYVSFYDAFTSYGQNSTIINANFNLRKYSYTTNSNNRKINVYALKNEPINPNWNNASTLNSSNVFISETQIGSDRWLSIDIKKLAQAWLNYTNSQYIVGIPNYGFKLVMNDADTQLTAYSERSNSYTPYISITYSISSNYTLDYAPYKYDNIIDSDTGGVIYNFQNRMNCYAYALQVYYRGNFINTSTYSLKPGEFGIGYSDSVSDYNDLDSQYDNYNSDSSFMDFIEARMEEDGMAIGFELNRISNNNSFSLPNNFNENNERIIAMVVGETFWLGIVDYHFYLRHGNGTCPNGHGGNCSAWSHKLAMGKVSFESIDGYTLCDANINNYSRQGSYEVSPPTRYYKITKDTNLYNSYHRYGHSEESTGTQYH